MTDLPSFSFEAPLWLQPGGNWWFVSLPTDLADEVADATAGFHRGFGSVRVAVTVGATTWRTSVFPDGSRGTYILPVKRQVRQAEGLADGGVVAVRIELVDL